MVKALGELAIAEWLSDNRPAAFHAMDQAGERLFACREGTNGWKSLFVLFAHVSGYFTSIAYSGRLPVETRGEKPMCRRQEAFSSQMRSISRTLPIRA